AHLFSPADEDKCFACGSERTTFAAEAWRIGLSICYDVRFPEFYRALVCQDGADVLINSSAWPFPRVEHLRVLATARAIENQSYFVLANRVGKGDGAVFCGSSAIIDPYGVILAAASADREELLVAEISSEVLTAVRKRTPVFEHRRAELYN
ncbi:MAG TPA: nitrilase-related carbon-nitrogen hydrolase, partial [Chthoniobacterales bacterium]